MPSPFPGMDPYLEAPENWPDVNLALTSQISFMLNQSLPEPYYAKLNARAELGMVEGEEGWEMIFRPRRSKALVDGAVLDQPRRELSPGHVLEGTAEWAKHPFVEVRDAKDHHKLVTLIEILSPSNKRSGPDRDAYSAKQSEVLESDASLIEIDLLRSGRRVLPNSELALLVAGLKPPALYLVLVSRAWNRTATSLGYHAYPFGLREWMPCVPVPLKETEPEVPLDLQYAFNRMYDAGPYRRSTDYSRPPRPPLSRTDSAWAAEELGVSGASLAKRESEAEAGEIGS